MPDIIKERLELIVKHCAVIMERIASAPATEEMNQDFSGGIVFDSLLTRLQALAEHIKKIQKLDPVFFSDTLPLDVTSIIRFRDLAAHHYEGMNTEIVFNICKTEVPPLKEKVQNYLTSHSSS